MGCLVLKGQISYMERCTRTLKTMYCIQQKKWRLTFWTNIIRMVTLLFIFTHKLDSSSQVPFLSTTFRGQEGCRWDRSHPSFIIVPERHSMYPRYAQSGICNAQLLWSRAVTMVGHNGAAPLCELPVPLCGQPVSSPFIAPRAVAMGQQTGKERKWWCPPSIWLFATGILQNEPEGRKAGGPFPLPASQVAL